VERAATSGLQSEATSTIKDIRKDEKTRWSVPSTFHAGRTADRGYFKAKSKKALIIDRPMTPRLSGDVSSKGMESALTPLSIASDCQRDIGLRYAMRPGRLAGEVPDTPLEQSGDSA
jgi:hypothetical protein